MAMFLRHASRVLRPRSNGTFSLFLAVPACLLATLPIMTILFLSLSKTRDIWGHLFLNVLPYIAQTTLLLLIGVSCLSLLIGVGTAWLVTMYQFPGRALFNCTLSLPLAVPSYILAYCYADFLSVTGPVQNALRSAFSWELPSDYWFPDIYGLGGAIFILSLSLYPYVFITARLAFTSQTSQLLAISRTLNHGMTRSFFRIALPLARPAIIAGVTLVCMETVNDIGTVEFFGVRTITLTIYSIWLGQGSLTAATQLSLLLLVLIFFLIFLERAHRHDALFRQSLHPVPSKPDTLHRSAAWLCSLSCALPLTLGFLIPIVLLLTHSFRNGLTNIPGSYLTCAGNSIFVSVLAAIATIAVTLTITYARYMNDSSWFRSLSGIAGIGYAIPGTVLAIGILIPLATLDNALDHHMRALFGISTGLLLSGSIFALVLAYLIRFLAIGKGPVETRMDGLNPHTFQVARTLGHSGHSAFLRTQLPLLIPATLISALLVFVDAIKELPATLLLRPFNFETLATHVYAYASLERFEDASFAALTIILVSTIPIITVSASGIPRQTPG